MGEPQLESGKIAPWAFKAKAVTLLKENQIVVVETKFQTFLTITLSEFWHLKLNLP